MTDTSVATIVRQVCGAVEVLRHETKKWPSVEEVYEWLLQKNKRVEIGEIRKNMQTLYAFVLAQKKGVLEVSRLRQITLETVGGIFQSASLRIHTGKGPNKQAVESIFGSTIISKPPAVKKEKQKKEKKSILDELEAIGKKALASEDVVLSRGRNIATRIRAALNGNEKSSSSSLINLYKTNPAERARAIRIIAEFEKAAHANDFAKRGTFLQPKKAIGKPKSSFTIRLPRRNGRK